MVAPRLIAALRAEVARRLVSQQLSAQQLCNLLWAFAQLRVRVIAAFRHDHVAVATAS